jgi:hypothetical protein
VEKRGGRVADPAPGADEADGHVNGAMAPIGEKLYQRERRTSVRMLIPQSRR